MIKIVHVYKGNGSKKRNSVVDAQVNSINYNDIKVIKFPLKTSGMFSYISEYIRLKKFVKIENPDLIHAHYSYSGIISALTSKKTICSLMGCDVFNDYLIIKLLVRFFYKYLWIETIVKSEQQLKLFSKAHLIPNGVDFKNFHTIPKDDAIANTKLKKNKINIIFVSENIGMKVKNYQLALDTMKFLPQKFDLHPVSGITHKELVNYYNAADALLLTSLSEGSPNVIKEAMACNCPIISTDVGDVKQIIKGTNFCYTSNFNPKEIAYKIEKATASKQRSNGRENIKVFDSAVIANKIVNIYRRAVR